MKDISTVAHAQPFVNNLPPNDEAESGPVRMKRQQHLLSMLLCLTTVSGSTPNPLMYFTQD
jgi:hypothetical protein